MLFQVIIFFLLATGIQVEGFETLFLFFYYINRIGQNVFYQA